MPKDLGCFADSRPIALPEKEIKGELERSLLYISFLRELRGMSVMNGKAFVLGGYPAVGFKRKNVTGCVVESSPRNRLILIQPSNDPSDFFWDAMAFQVPLMVLGNEVGKVHAGFYNMFEMVKSTLLGVIDSMDPSYSKIYTVAGHSMGAGVGTLVSEFLVDQGITVDECVLIGAPRVGNKKFVSWVESRVSFLRVVNRYDIVTSLPPPPYYRHTDRVVYLKDGNASRSTPMYRKFLAPILIWGVKDHFLDSYRTSLLACLKKM